VQIGVRVMQFQHDWQRLQQVALRADEAGFDSIYLSDHLMHTSDVSRSYVETWTALSALAGETKHSDIGSVLCISFRSPALLAKMVTAADIISGGRLALILGAGWSEPEYRAFGFEFPSARERVDYLAEAFQVLRGLLDASPKPFSFEGRYLQVRDAVNVPIPMRRIPFALGGTGPRMIRLAARYADEWNCAEAGMDNYPELAEVMAEAEGLWGRTVRKAASVSFVPGRSPSAGGYRTIGGSHEQLIDQLGNLTELGFDSVNAKIATEAEVDTLAGILPDAHQLSR
jgi:alkanesulfonate monooxygenase SsuD/methylene tetrahydromethanopterin reductase-like flavin-dependent oxidoreductase (luciferase family)